MTNFPLSLELSVHPLRKIQTSLQTQKRLSTWKHSIRSHVPTSMKSILGHHLRLLTSCSESWYSTRTSEAPLTRSSSTRYSQAFVTRPKRRLKRNQSFSISRMKTSLKKDSESSFWRSATTTENNVCRIEALLQIWRVPSRILSYVLMSSDKFWCEKPQSNRINAKRRTEIWPHLFNHR